MRWRHVVIGTVNSWLPGDPRGFRTWRHKVHSSGDYRDLPPAGEHAGLFARSKQISGDPVILADDLRETVGKAILQKLEKLQYQVLVLAVAGMHCHFLAELPDDLKAIRSIVGQCKTVSSHAIRERLPGRVWARDGSYKPVDTPEYQRNVFQYILDQEGAWTWSFRERRDASPAGFEDSPRGLDTNVDAGASPAGLEDSPRGLDTNVAAGASPAGLEDSPRGLQQTSKPRGESANPAGEGPETSAKPRGESANPAGMVQRGGP
jgi:REP element-mobilizing transposase RayT